MQNPKERSYNWASILYTESCVTDIGGGAHYVQTDCVCVGEVCRATRYTHKEYP